MSLIYNITDPSLVYLTDLPHRMRPFQEVGAPHRRHWLENYSYYNESEDVASLYNSSISPASVYDPLGGHTVWQVILIGFFTGVLSLVTIIGNILVLLSFKVNKQLKTVNNYYLLSLAIADLIIGIVSMNLYTTYIIMDQWAMGNWACDLWLTIDYVASNASVMNLLVISFDRYFSITRPLTYRAKRTTKRAVTMIVLAWSISFVLWAPAILFWQFFVGERTVQPGKCYIQFLTEPIITFCTAIAAFYLPVTIMSVLYWRIYKETENRSRELEGLQGSGNQGEAARVAHPSRGSYKLNLPLNRRLMGRLRLWPPLLMGRKPKGHGEPEHSSSDSWNNNDAGTSMDPSDSEEEEIPETRAIYSIVLNLPGMKAAMNSRLACPSDLDASEEDPLRAKCSGSKQQIHSMHTIEVPKTAHSFGNKSPSAPISFKEAALAKRFAAKAKSQITKRKKLSLVKEKKAAQTLSAILFAFIITWTPYNIMVLMNTFCTDCIPETLWALGYWLCYVNSTVNPMCYALCNKTFRTTFRMILLCRWDSGRRNKQQPQVPRSHAVAFRRKIPGAS